MPDANATPKGRKFTDITGLRFGRWTVLRYSHSDQHRFTQWECRCECGTVRVVSRQGLRSGKSQSCGCLHVERHTARLITHGMTNDPTGTYRVWKQIISRCNCPSATHFNHYGGRGIKVCDAWSGREGFATFARDMGTRPSPTHSIDRIDVNGNYEPGNCRWATNRDQCRNKRTTHILTHEGESLCVTDWAAKRGWKVEVIHTRLRLGWSVEKTLSEPVKPRTFTPEMIAKIKSKLPGRSGADVAREFGVSRQIISQIRTGKIYADVPACP